MNCFAITFPGSDIGELSQAIVVNSDHRPTCSRRHPSNAALSYSIAASVSRAIRTRLEFLSSGQAVQPIEQESLVRIHDLFRLVDSRHHALEGSPAHPLGFSHVIADPALRAELAPKLESTAQGSIP